MEKVIFKSIPSVKVGLRFTDEVIPVGQLMKDNHLVYFIFDNQFIEQGMDISPLNCPLRPGALTFDDSFLNGLPGVLYDSLPDGWGLRLLSRKLSTLDIDLNELSSLDQLCYVGTRGMGALVYEPNQEDETNQTKINIEQLAQESEEFLSGDSTDTFEQLLSLNGSSGGARPKAMISLHKNKKDVIHGMSELPTDYEPWLVKFSSTGDGADAGAIEFVYALMAKNAGLDMPEVHLFPAKNGAGFFSVKRFDRMGSERIHMHSVAGILHTDFRYPFLDYRDLLALTMKLTKDIREVEKMYQLAVFNVLAHNRDDHAKNFSFLMTVQGEWNLSPAYDLTFSSGPSGEQSTTIMGQGKNPTKNDLVQLGEEMKIKKQTIENIIDKTQTALSEWEKLAKQYGVRKSEITRIRKKINI